MQVANKHRWHKANIFIKDVLLNVFHFCVFFMSFHCVDDTNRSDCHNRSITQFYSLTLLLSKEMKVSANTSILTKCDNIDQRILHKNFNINKKNSKMHLNGRHDNFLWIGRTEFAMRIYFKVIFIFR